MKKIRHTEQQLVKGCLKGKQAAQKGLYDLYLGQLMTVCRRYARDDMEAEDFLQEGYIKVFNNLKSFRGEGSLYGWMKTIMVHTALRQIKKRMSVEDTAGVYHISSDPTILSKLNAEDIIHTIQQLPEGYKMIFNLYHIEGYSHKEIGELLQIGESTSRSQLTKARKMLKTHITDQENVIL